MAIVVQLVNNALGELAIERAAREAGERDEPLVLVGSVVMPRSEAGAEDYQTRRDEIETALQRRTRHFASRGIKTSAYLPAAPMDAADAVLEAARENDASMIVVGIRRRSPVGKLVLGSVAQDVILGADCPVLGVKLPRELEEK